MDGHVLCIVPNKHLSIQIHITYICIKIKNKKTKLYNNVNTIKKINLNNRFYQNPRRSEICLRERYVYKKHAIN